MNKNDQTNKMDNNIIGLHCEDVVPAGYWSLKGYWVGDDGLWIVNLLNHDTGEEIMVNLEKTTLTERWGVRFN